MLFIAITFSVIFIFCEIGEKLKSSFNQIDDEFNNLDWYLFPMDGMKIVSMIMIITQKTVALRGYRNIEYDREQFKKVTGLSVILHYIRIIEFIISFVEFRCLKLDSHALQHFVIYKMESF